MPARSRYRACEHGIDLSGNAPEDMEDVAARTQSCSPAHHSAELVPTSHSLTLHTRPVIPQSSRSQGDRIPLGAGSSDSHHLFFERSSSSRTVVNDRCRGLLAGSSLASIGAHGKEVDSSGHQWTRTREFSSEMSNWPSAGHVT